MVNLANRSAVRLLVLLLGTAVAKLQVADSRGADTVIVSTTEGLQAAVSEQARLIKVVDHINLVGLHAGTPDEDSIVFPDAIVDMAIWGDCGTHLNGSEVRRAGIFQHNPSNQTMASNSCTILTGSSDGLKNANGRLWLSNFVLLAMPSQQGPATHGVALSGGELWLVSMNFAGFRDTAVMVVDGSAFIMESNFQGVPNSQGGEAAIAFLGRSSKRNTLFLSSAAFAYHPTGNYAPVYVSPDLKRPPSTMAPFVALLEVDEFQTAPLIVVAADDTLLRPHVANTCMGLCIAYRQGVKPAVYASRGPQVLPITNGWGADDRFVVTLMDQNSMPAGRVDDIGWADVKPQTGNLDAWLLFLAAANVADVQQALHPSNINIMGGATPPSQFNSYSSTSTGLFKIAFLVLSIMVTGVVLIVAPLCYAYRRSKETKADMLELQVRTPEDLQMSAEGVTDDVSDDDEDEDVAPDGPPPPRRTRRNWIRRHRASQAARSASEREALPPAAAIEEEVAPVPLETIKVDFHIDPSNIGFANLFWGGNGSAPEPPREEPAS